MTLNESEKTIISSLKGRLSKILGAKVKLSKLERASLESVYSIVDNIILKDKTRYKKLLLEELENLSTSKKNYVQEHIIPLVKKISKEDTDV